MLSGDVAIEDIAEAPEVEVKDLESLLAIPGIGNVEAKDPNSFEEFTVNSPIKPLLASVQPDQFTSEDFYLPSPIDLFRYSDPNNDSG